MIPSFAILLAGYEGSKYFREQIFSILNQRNVKVEIFVRVDGICPIFKKMVTELSLEYTNIHYLPGDAVSSSGMNFYNLIFGMDNSQFDYYALCDQDDIWLNSKLWRAHICLRDDHLMGYSSGFCTFNSAGSLKRYFIGNQGKFDFLFQSAGPGCTFVLKNKGFFILKSCLLNNPELSKVSAHDWLIYFIFRLHGLGWYLDSESHLLYRQHSSNVSGVNSGIAAKIKRLSILFNGWYYYDLRILIPFAQRYGLVANFKNPFELRRSKFESLFIWFYFNLYFKRRLNFS
jgi:rhamnosyltransferase